MRTNFALFPFLAMSQLPAASGIPAVPPTGEVTRTATIAGVIGALIVLGREYITWRRQLVNGPRRDEPRDEEGSRSAATPLRLELAGDKPTRPSNYLDDNRTD